MTLSEAKEISEAWRREYHESRPHRAFGERTSNEFAQGIAARRDSIGLANSRKLALELVSESRSSQL
jgi:hypothetical protein